MYIKPQIEPGMSRDGSQYEAMNTWFNGNNVRFKLGKPQSVGGWEEKPYQDFDELPRDLNGIARSIFQWVSGNGSYYTLIGTTWKVYLIHVNSIYDVTPLKSDNLTLESPVVAPATDDYSFPAYEYDATNKTQIWIRKTTPTVAGSGNIARVETTVNANVVENYDNGFCMIKDLDFTTTGIDVTPSDFNSGYKGSTKPLKPSNDDGWQMYKSFGFDYFKIDAEMGLMTGFTLNGNSDPLDSITQGQTIDIPIRWNVGFQPNEGDVILVNVGLTIEYIQLGTATLTVGQRTLYGGSGLGEVPCVRGMFGTSDSALIVAGIYTINWQMYERKLDLQGPTAKIWYNINPGLDREISLVASSSWGIGSWSSGVWGGSSLVPATAETSLRFWSFCANGDDIVMSPTNGEIYYLSLKSITGVANTKPDNEDVFTRRVRTLEEQGEVNSITPVKIPTVNGDILLTTLSGHLISFSTQHFSGGSQTEVSPILVRWSDNDLNDLNIFDWGLRSTNTSGGLVLNSGSTITGMIETNREVLVWTDVSLYSMRYVGPPSVFTLTLISSNVNLIARHASVVVGGEVFFMGIDSFYSYKGQLSMIPCTVSNFVFDNINTSQKDKIYAFQNERFSEISWCYPSANSFEVDLYVTYNYLDKVWYTGNFDMIPVEVAGVQGGAVTGYNRTSWIDANLEETPVSTYIKTFDLQSQPQNLTTGILSHDTGYARVYQGVSPETLDSFIESGDVGLDDSGTVFFMRRFLPDIYWTGSAPNAEGDGIDMVFSAKKYPDSFAPTSTSNAKVFEPTEYSSTIGTGNPVPRDGKYDIRGRGTTFSIKLTSSTQNYGWRVGDVSIDIKPDGKRS
jgi:hypothetical protein